MLKFYKTTAVEKKLKKAKTITENSWIDMVSPDKEEIEQVVKITGIDEDLILKMLDDEERPRIEESGNAVLIVIDTPYLETEEDHFVYNTSPLEDFRTAKKTRFVIQILYNTAQAYIRALRVVSRKIELKEEVLSKSTSNRDLLDMLDLEKTLVYFLTSLKANDLVLDKLSKGVVLPLFEGDDDLLDDAIIENKQAIEQSEIYRNILSSITETYGTIVSNNLNEIMKFLAGATIVISVPTMISSFLGMNVPLGELANNPLSASLIFIASVVLSIIVAIILYKKNML